MTQFFRSQNGFALILTLVMLPVFIGLCALVIDVGRAFNAQADMQAAADALAVAGARELDGESDAITRAVAAMEKLSNGVDFTRLDAARLVVSTKGASKSAASVFLTEIPESDDTPIDAAYINDHSTKVGTLARYVYVQVEPASLVLALPLFKSFKLSAVAVARGDLEACNVAPIYMCSPFGSDFDVFEQAFNKANTINTVTKDSAGKPVSVPYGYFQGRLFRIASTQSLTVVDYPDSPTSQTTTTLIGPEEGNFGFLDAGNGSKPVAEAIASGISNVCFDRVATTQPGKLASVSQGFNTRFDMYDGSFGLSGAGSLSNASYYPALNVIRESGFSSSGCGNIAYPSTFSRNLSSITQDPPTSLVMTDPTTGGSVSPAANYTLGPVSGVYWNLFSPVIVSADKGGQPVTYQPYWQSLYGVDELTKLETKTETTTKGNKTTTTTTTTKVFDSVKINTLLADITSIPNMFPSRYDMYRYETKRRFDLLKPLVISGTTTSELPSCNPTAKTADWTPASTTNVIRQANAIQDRRTMEIAIVNCPANPVKGGRRSVDIIGTAKIFLVGPMDAKSNKSIVDFEIIGANGAGKARTVYSQPTLVR